MSQERAGWSKTEPHIINEPISHHSWTERQAHSTQRGILMKRTQRREATVTPFLPPYNKCERQVISAANLNRTWKLGNPGVKQKIILIFLN